MHETALREQARVIYALILRDTRTRFGRTFAGFLIIILWPLTHGLFLMLGYFLAHKAAPIGTDIGIFVGTGVIPYILCLYPARMMNFSLVHNQHLFAFPIVKPFDVILARGILEIVVAFWVVAIFCSILFVAGIDFMPHRPEEAVLALAATVYLSVAIGFVSAVCYKIFRAWYAIFIGSIILAYVGSGAFFIPTYLPPLLRDVIWFNPLFQAVEWLRSSFYEGYGDGMLSRGYLLGYSTLTLFLGLALERGLRGKLQQIW